MLRHSFARISSPTLTRMASTLAAAPAQAPSWQAWRLNPPCLVPAESNTMASQDALPCLPVPELSSTLNKLRASVRALARTDDELNTTLAKIQSFETNEGPKLQEKLRERAAERDQREGNWIAESWDTNAYMAYRDSVVINVSYAFGFKKLPQGDSASAPNDPTYVAATIALKALEFCDQITSGKLQPDKAGEAALCMESYKWMFNACRIPAKPADYAVKLREDDPSGQHLIAIRRNRFYKIALSANGQRPGLAGLQKAFAAVYQEADRSAVMPPVGALTSWDRDNWTDARVELMKDPGNSATLAEIERASFVIALDEECAGSSFQNKSDDIVAMSHQMLHSDGKNRFFDKPLQWIVRDDGEAGFIGEHSCMDGTPTARMNDWLTHDLLSHKLAPGSDASTQISPPTEVKFALSTITMDHIAQAIQAHEKNVADNCTVGFTLYRRYGKNQIKKQKCSPDGWTQMTMQLAHALTEEGQLVGTYEAAMTRRFKLGRTETVRVCTEQAVKWVKSMLSKDASDDERRQLFRDALAQHGKDMKDASAAQGIDRHLVGLKWSADGNVPDLYSDGLYQRAATWTMSTSQIYSLNFHCYLWGRVVRYGFPYMIHPDSLQFTITGDKDAKTQEMVRNCGVAADMVMDLFERAPSAKL